MISVYNYNVRKKFMEVDRFEKKLNKSDIGSCGNMSCNDRLQR